MSTSEKETKAQTAQGSEVLMDRQELARLLLGQGLLGRTADIKKLHPIWQKEFMAAQMSGQDYPQFEDWFSELNTHASTMKPTLRSGMAMSDL